MSERFGSLVAEFHEVPNPTLTAVLVHGIGLGPWFWEPWLPTFRSAGVRVINTVLPGHREDPEDVGLAAAAERLGRALDTLSGPVALVGHSAGALVAQLAAVGRHLHALALVCPVPPGQIRYLPEGRDVLAGLALVPALLAGRAIVVPWSAYRQSGLEGLDEAVAREVYARVQPWPNRLVRDLLRRPHLDPLQVHGPVMTFLGLRDRVVPWQKARVLGDLYEGVVWRYDDCGHMPPFDANGLRMGRDLVRLCKEPIRPQVIESEGFMPSEGVGHALRRSRRGELMKKRSAYGQKKAAR